MSYLVALIVVPLALVAVASLCDAQVHDGRTPAAPDETLFRIAAWVYFLLAINGLMCGAFIYWSFDPAEAANARCVFRAVGGLGLLGAILAAWWYAGSAIRLSTDEIRITSPLREKTLRFENIKSVEASNGMIVLDEGKIPRTVIPIVYRRSNVMLANIRQRLAAQNRH